MSIWAIGQGHVAVCFRISLRQSHTDLVLGSRCCFLIIEHQLTSIFILCLSLLIFSIAGHSPSNPVHDTLVRITVLHHKFLREYLCKFVHLHIYPHCFFGGSLHYVRQNVIFIFGLAYFTEYDDLQLGSLCCKR